MSKKSENQVQSHEINPDRQKQTTVMFAGKNRNSWEHNEEMLQLYEEMEKHIDCEKQRIEQQVNTVSWFDIHGSSSIESRNYSLWVGLVGSGPKYKNLI